MTWIKPVQFEVIPVEKHPGAFGALRKGYRNNALTRHTGIDLYCKDGEAVYPVEEGEVVAIEPFTGAIDGSPWWEDTYCILIEGKTGVVCYGELIPCVSIGQAVNSDVIGNVKRVIKIGKERPDIPYHKTSMLHFELYAHGTRSPSNGFEEDKLLDPTKHLIGIGGIDTCDYDGYEKELMK